MTRLSDRRVQDALQRIKDRRKDGWLQQMLDDVEKVDANLNNMEKVNDNLNSLDNLYKQLDQKTDGQNNQQVYKDVYSSFSNSLKEHMKILTEHAKEKIYEIQENPEENTK
jgi:RNA polymerase-interacting CarD/CdnL/TRCF family regulator